MTRRRLVKRGSRAWWHLRANAGVVGWLLATVIVAVAHSAVPAWGWLVVHLSLLGAASNAILVWSAHFASSLLRTNRANSYRSQAARLVAVNLGVVLVVVGILACAWSTVAGGAVLVVGAVLWHGGSLARQMAGSAATDFGVVVWFYLAATLCLVGGAGLGPVLVVGLGESVWARLVVAHVMVNVLGWVGLTVIGTLTVLWPSMLRTRRSPRGGQAARVALAVLSGAVAIELGSVLAGLRPVAAAGLVVYLIGVVIAAGPLFVTARQRLPSSYAAWSVMAGCGWLVGDLVALVWVLSGASDWADVVVTCRPSRCPPSLVSSFRCCSVRSVICCRWCWVAAPDR